MSTNYWRSSVFVPRGAGSMPGLVGEIFWSGLVWLGIRSDQYVVSILD